MNKRRFTGLALMAALSSGAPLIAAGIDDVTNKPMFPVGGLNPYNLMQAKPSKPVELRKHEPTLEELIVKQNVPGQYLQPIPLRGVHIAGLYPKSVETLGMQYFAVVDNSKVLRMSDVYRESRLAGKSNFVTADSITHPYLAFANRIIADAVPNMIPDLRTLLQAMQRIQLADYNTADDKEVKQDIERNVAYVSVALRFLDPKYEVPRIGQVPELVDRESQLIVSGTTAQSVIFEGTQDYSVFKPYGWYNSSDQLKNFFRCREWLSLVPFAVNDTGGGEQHSNMFRRSVLIFRSLDRANILGRPAMETWVKLVKGYEVLGSHVEAWGQRTLYPQDYKYVFQDKSSDLRVTLQALAEPFFRTKLMLALRNQKPVNLDSESIFELSPNDSSSTMPVFRLFPMIGQPEVPWLRGVASIYPPDRSQSESWPLSLIDMYAWGSPMAGNLLADNISALDPNIARALPTLQHCVVTRLPSGQLTPVESRAWGMMSHYFRPMPETAPSVLRTELWLSQRQMSAIGGWVDALSAIAPADDEGSAQSVPSSSGLAPAGKGVGNAGAGSHSGLPPAATNATTPAVDEKTAEGISPAKPDAPAVPRRVSKVPPFHYLEPNLDTYKHLEMDATKLQAQLEAVHYFPQKHKAKLADFVRLFQRLQKITTTELHGVPISLMDRRLLGDIDLILDKVDVPLPAVLSFDGGKSQGDMMNRGFNMAIGRPGVLYIIYQNPHSMEWTLGRGAVYTYYETPAPLLTDTMWQHKVEAGFAVPPSWSQRFELVQQPKAEQHPAMVKMN
jgi:hypothetical protein